VSKVVSCGTKVKGESKGVLGRSLRVRGATLGVAAGIPAEILKTVANWRAAGASSMRISEMMGFGTTLPSLEEGKRGQIRMDTYDSYSDKVRITSFVDD
jgi:hypothetical protein